MDISISNRMALYLRMKRFFALLLIAALGLVLLSCDSNKNAGSLISSVADFPVTVNGVKVDAAPQKVVSLSPTLTEIVYALGSGAQLCAVSDSCDYPPDTSGLPAVGDLLSSKSPDIDKIAVLGATLILISAPLPDDVMARLAVHKIQVAVFTAATDYSSLTALYEQVGKVLSGNVTGKSNADMTVRRMLDSINAVKTAVAPGGKKAVCILSADGAVATGDTLVGALLQSAGATNIAASAKGYVFSASQIASASPDFIFCPANLVNSIQKNPAYAKTPAVKQHHVVGLDGAMLERQGDRIVTLVTQMAAAMYPSAMSSEASSAVSSAASSGAKSSGKS